MRAHRRDGSGSGRARERRPGRKRAPSGGGKRAPDDALFRGVLDSAPDGIVVVDAEGRIVLANARAEHLFGYGPGALVDAPVERLLPERLRDAHVAHRLTYQSSPRTRPMAAGIDLVARRKDGTEFPVEISLSPLRAGKDLLVTAIVRDVTERRAAQKRAEAAREELLAIAERARTDAEHARQTLERVQAVTDVAPARVSLDEALPELLARIHRMLVVDTTAILLVDESGARLRLQAAFGLDDWRAGEVVIPVGEGFTGRVAAERRPIALEAVDPGDGLDPLLLERGVRSLLGVPLLADGRVFGVLHVGSCEPRRFTDDDVRLLQLVADRLALVVVRGRLYEAEHDARAAAESNLRTRAELEQLKDDLTNMVVHDLKNPVNGIAMLAQLALRKGTDLPAAPRNSLLQIERTCREMMRLIQNVLEISKLEEGKMPVSHEAIVLAEVVDEIVAEYGPVAEQTGRRLTASVGIDLPYVVADRALLKRVLVNLVVNGLRHSGSQQVTVDASHDALTARLRLEVTDHGRGIAEEDQARVFEKFASIRRSGDGHASSDTGLGLPFCKLATECMGGEIALRSHPEAGTVFTVVLPARPAG